MTLLLEKSMLDRYATGLRFIAVALLVIGAGWMSLPTLAQVKQPIKATVALPQSTGPTVIALPQRPLVIQSLDPNFIGPFTRPPVTGFSIDGFPLHAHLHWNVHYLQDVDSVYLWRIDAPNAPPVLLAHMPIGLEESNSVVPNVGVTYRFRLVVRFVDGTHAFAELPFTSPPLANPASFQATLTSPNTVQLQWRLMPDAAGYRISGPGMSPNTVIDGNTYGFTLNLTTMVGSTVVKNVPIGIQAWQIVAVYDAYVGGQFNGTQFQGGQFQPFADSQHPTSTSVMNRAIPPHAPAWLTKNNGAGSIAQTAAHYLQFNKRTGNGTEPGFAALGWIGTDSAGLGIVDLAPNPQVSYKNVSELGVERVTGCFRGVGENGPDTICWSETPDVRFSLIIIDTKGARFASFDLRSDPASWGWPSMYVANASATYDSEGPKYVPQVCLSCHGGHYDPVSNLVVGATFLPIDPGLVQIHGSPGNPAVGNTAAALEQVRQINLAIFLSNPGSPVGQYINGMYNGLQLVPGTAGAANYIPQGWAQEPAPFYHDIIKPHCTMCHLAIPSMSFLTAGQFLQNGPLVYSDVCVTRSMPHAELPFRDLYTSGGYVYMPGMISARLGYANCP